jgi:hypothetical protein
MTQMAFRVGDSATHALCPFKSYLPVIIGLLEQHAPTSDEKIGIGTVVSLQVGFSGALLLSLSLLLAAWYLLGLPLGPGVPVLTEQPEIAVRLIADRIAAGDRVRQTLPCGGKLYIERPLPFLVVYRRPGEHDDSGTERLAATEAAYLTASSERRWQHTISRLVRTVAERQSAHFGAFLVIEIWSAARQPADAADAGAGLQPRFQVHAGPGCSHAWLDYLCASLSQVRANDERAIVDLDLRGRCAPLGARPLLSAAAAERLSSSLVGIEVDPIYRDPASGRPYPKLLTQLSRGVSRALQKTAHRFACKQTSHCPVHYQVLGSRAIASAVWRADRAIAAFANRFEFFASGDANQRRARVGGVSEQRVSNGTIVSLSAAHRGHSCVETSAVQDPGREDRKSGAVRAFS